MSFINYSSREINCKIVYYGPGLCGKTTNLQYVYAKTNPDAKGKMISLATETERTLFFDFLPLSLGEIRGFKTRFHLYTVPGQVFYDASRKLILKGVDGVVFVADSQIERMEANLESAENLRVNLAEQGYNLDKLPYVVQYNKRDLPNIATVEELRRLSELAKNGKIELEYVGIRPNLDQIKLAGGGEIDAMIRDVALELGASFLTSDQVQSRVAEAMGLDVEYVRPQREAVKPLSLEKYFTEDTLSIHLKESAIPMAKRGRVGDFSLVHLGDRPLSERELRDLSREIYERAKVDPEGYVEMEKMGATIIQLGPMRIAIAKPPFSDGLEITAVRPVAKVSFDSYRHSGMLKERLKEGQRGILIAGPPGSGKSTFLNNLLHKFEEYANREGDIVTGIIQQTDQRYTLLDLGRVEALLPQAE